MSDEELDGLLQELIREIYESRCEIRALRDLLVDRKTVTDEELALRIDEARFEFIAELKTDASRRRFERLLGSRPIQ